MVGAIVGIVFRYNLADDISFNANGEIFEIEFESGWNMQEASQQYFEPGVCFYINIDSIKIGEITEILDVRNPAFQIIETVKGDLVKSEVPGRIDVIGVMRSTGRITKTGEFMINGNQFVAPNKEFLVHTGYLEGTIRITSVRKVDG